jgi:hypothetical protein
MRFGPPKIVARSGAGARRWRETRPCPHEPPPGHSQTSLRRHPQDGGSASRQRRNALLVESTPLNLPVVRPPRRYSRTPQNDPRAGPITHTVQASRSSRPIAPQHRAAHGGAPRRGLAGRDAGSVAGGRARRFNASGRLMRASYRAAGLGLPGCRLARSLSRLLSLRMATILLASAVA